MEKIGKREFIKRSVIATLGFSVAGGKSFGSGRSLNVLWKYSHESMFYSVTSRGARCELCPNYCLIRPGDISRCNNRINVNGKLYSIAYGNPCAVHIDPIEKKPLFHFFPASQTYSIAAAGCNFSCLSCQNWEISQTSPYKTKNIELFPKKVVESCISEECSSISYTYTEPVSFYEYMYQTAKLAHESKIKNILISNGYINEAPLKHVIPYLDAVNIDLKSFSNETYLRLNGGELQPVLNTLRLLKDAGVWLEITNLVIPSWTDDMDMIKKMCEWLALNGFANIPLHFSRFQPIYKLTQLPETPLQTLVNAKEIAFNAGLNYVYLGNVPGKNYENTQCPGCKNTVIERRGYTILSNNLKNGKCSFCGKSINGRWS